MESPGAQFQLLTVSAAEAWRTFPAVEMAPCAWKVAICEALLDHGQVQVRLTEEPSEATNVPPAP